MSLIQTICEWIIGIITFGANFVTLILGIVAIWILIFHSRKVSLFFQVLRSNFFNEKAKRIKETLGKLESLNYENKDDRPEINALLGQVSGQIKHFTSDDGELSKIHHELLDILAKKMRLSEPNKRRLIYEIHGALDNVTDINARSIIEEVD
jgi:hypothetical protein